MKLKDLIESNNTGLDAIKRAPIVDYDTGVRCLRIGDISNNRPFNEWGYTEVEDNNYSKFQLKTGDIIVARTGATIGVNKYIDKNGGGNAMKVTLNPDEEVVKVVKEGLERTGGYCPCRRERTPENLCMCEEFKKQIQDPEFEGFCHCMLYYKSKD